jgi:hypothetical protein
MKGKKKDRNPEKTKVNKRKKKKSSQEEKGGKG